MSTLLDRWILLPAKNLTTQFFDICINIWINENLNLAQPTALHMPKPQIEEQKR